MHTKFWSENLEGRNHAEDLGVDGDNIRIDLREVEWESVDWMHLAQDRDKLWAFLNMVINFRVPLKGGEFLD
jgi:hypothetical protein